MAVYLDYNATTPLDPQSQHDGDFTAAFASMCKTVAFFTLLTPQSIMPAYRWALEHEGASLLVEYVDRYDQET